MRGRMSKQTDNYSALASALGFRYDMVNNVLYGQKDGYNIIIYAADSASPYLLTVHTAAKNAYGANLTREQTKALSKSVKPLGLCTQDGNNITVTISAGVGKRVKLEKMQESVAEGLTGFINFLREKGFNPCCSICGKEEEVSGYRAGGSYHHLCAECEKSMREKIATTNSPKRENVVGGIVGALLGSLLGVICIIVFSQLGYVAALSGAVMAVGVLKGYELLGGKITKKGVVICVIIMLIMAYAGDRLNWAILLYREGGGADIGYNIFECYRIFPDALAAGMIRKEAYIMDIVLIYVFLLLGAVPTISKKLKEKQEEGRMVKVGSADVPAQSSF